MKVKSIREIHDDFDRKMISPSEWTRHFLHAIRKSHHNAYLTVCEERALRQAQQADAVLEREGKVPRSRMPLFGIPIGIKDNLTLGGVRTTCASRILDNYIPSHTATAVERLEAKGAVILGKLNLDEFAMGSSNENSAYGPVIHPTHPDRVPGGSSGGSAAAVRAGLCMAALGTDTGGSIRLPASYCGVIGLKPTFGRVSRYGLVAFASSLDQIGPMTNFLDDAAVLLEAMSGHDPKDSTSSYQPPFSAKSFLDQRGDKMNWKGLRIGIPKEYFPSDLFSRHSNEVGPMVADGVKRAIQRSLEALEAKGAQLVPLSLPHTSYAVAVYSILAASEASSNLARYDGVRFGVRPLGAREAKNLGDFYKEVRAQFGSEVKRRILLGTLALSRGSSTVNYARACQVRRLIQQDFDDAFRQVDLLVGPVSPTTAYQRGEKRDPLQPYLNDFFTIPANLAGLPALSIPCGQDQDGLPIGLQLIAPALREERLFSIGRAIELERASEDEKSGGTHEV